MSEAEVRGHLRSVVGRLGADGALPPHYPTCLGCGPDAVQGFHLQVRREGDEVVADHVFEVRHSGAPGIAHGGAVATVVDDVLGFLLYLVQVAGVTRMLQVDYLQPVRTGERYEVRARVEERDGRKVWVSCSGRDSDGVEAFRARALFLAVPLEHFFKAATVAARGGEGQDPVAP